MGLWIEYLSAKQEDLTWIQSQLHPNVFIYYRHRGVQHVSMVRVPMQELWKVKLDDVISIFYCLWMIFLVVIVLGQ